MLSMVLGTAGGRDGAVAAYERRVVGVDVGQLACDAVPDHALRRRLRRSGFRQGLGAHQGFGVSVQVCKSLK
jgi:hypothetical protein